MVSPGQKFYACRPSCLQTSIAAVSAQKPAALTNRLQALTKPALHSLPNNVPEAPWQSRAPH